MSNIVVGDLNNKVVVATSFKPKVVELHSRENLDRFKELATTTGIGLNWPQWRFFLEIGSKLWDEAAAKGAISKQRVSEIEDEMGYQRCP